MPTIPFTQNTSSFSRKKDAVRGALIRVINPRSTGRGLFWLFALSICLSITESVSIPEMIRTLGLSRRQAGDIFNACFLAYICLSLFVGNLTDRLGARKVIPLLGIILGIGTMLMGTADSFSQASLFFAIVGVGAASMWTPIITLVQKWFVVKRRGMPWVFSPLGSVLVLLPWADLSYYCCGMELALLLVFSRHCRPHNGVCESFSSE
ncbi:MAG: MFS transporter [Syntrophales bacterium]